MTSEWSPKQLGILRSALELLVEAGDAGLTMRKLSERNKMHLSNVQYYFKSRDDVLKAMVAVYFQDCIDDVTPLTEAQALATPEDRLRYIIGAGLSHGETISDLCKTFREVWAISSRNAEIHSCLMGYYRDFGEKLVGFAVGDDIDTTTRDQLKSVLVPYIEGYSITAPSLPLDTHAATELLTQICLSLIAAPKAGAQT